MKTRLLAFFWWLRFRLSSERWFWSFYAPLINLGIRFACPVKHKAYIAEAIRRNEIRDERTRIAVAEAAMEHGYVRGESHFDPDCPASEVVFYLDGPSDPDNIHPSRL